MENAGRAVGEAVLRNNGGRPVLILAGPGNNGGDGMVAARHLHNAGVAVTVLLLAPRDKYRDAAGGQLAILEAMRLPIEVVSAGHAELRDWFVDAMPGDLVVDAIFGTGLSRPPERLFAEVISAVNASGHPVLAVDIPSGLECDSGQPVGSSQAVIRATETVSFCGSKKGFAVGKAYTGKVTVADIGAPRQLLESLASK
jgi:NAD(P)H-hydrate epimerase